MNAPFFVTFIYVPYLTKYLLCLLSMKVHLCFIVKLLYTIELNFLSMSRMTGTYYFHQIYLHTVAQNAPFSDDILECAIVVSNIFIHIVYIYFIIKMNPFQLWTILFQVNHSYSCIRFLSPDFVYWKKICSKLSNMKYKFHKEIQGPHVFFLTY